MEGSKNGIQKFGEPSSTRNGYLSTFLCADGTSEEEEEEEERVPRSQNFFYSMNDDAPAGAQGLAHPAKRRRTSSSGSDPDTRHPPKQLSSSGRNSRKHSENSNLSRSRTSSDKSVKSGTIRGTYGSRPCHRPRPPSSPETFNNNTVGLPPGKGATRARFPNSSSESEKSGNCFNSQEVSDTTSPVTPDPVTSPPVTSPPVKSELPDTDGQTEEVYQDFLPIAMSRPGRTAAAKAQDLIKSFGSRVKKLRARSGDSEGSASDYCSDGSLEAGVPKYTLDAELLRSLHPPLQTAYRFYAQIRNDPLLRVELVPFMEPVNLSQEATKDYLKKVERPMCLRKIEEKMENLNYFTVAEIIGDIRLVLENCYRFNGFDSWISKMACKVEMALEQRITLLPYSVRGKCGMTDTSSHLTLFRDVCGRRTRTPRVWAGCSRSPIMLAMEEMQLYRARESVIMADQQIARAEQRLQEDTVTVASHVRDNAQLKTIASSWEFISSCLVICVCQEVFNIPFTVGATELALLYPKHSPYLAKLMVALTASAKRAKELERQDKITYDEWNTELRGRSSYWYDWIQRFGRGNTYKTQTKLGITSEVLQVFGSQAAPLGWNRTITESPSRQTSRKQFHELSLKQRITLLNCLCTTKVTMSPRLQVCFDEYEAESTRPTNLGQDGQGNLYFHFPLWPEEIRVFVELPLSQDQQMGEVVCIARSCDDLQLVINQLKEQGKLGVLPGKGKGGPKVRALVKEARPLVAALESLLQEQLPHKAHHMLVDTNIYREIAESMRGQDEIPAPETAPPTPPRPVSPPVPDTSSELPASGSKGRSGHDYNGAEKSSSFGKLLFRQHDSSSDEDSDIEEKGADSDFNLGSASGSE